jgi:uncharacterized protein YpuA (DUF1002 family)
MLIKKGAIKMNKLTAREKECYLAHTRSAFSSPKDANLRSMLESFINDDKLTYDRRIASINNVAGFELISYSATGKTAFCNSDILADLDSLKNQVKNVLGLSADDVQQLLEARLRGFGSNTGLSEADVNKLVEEKLSSFKSNNAGLSEVDVNKLLEAKLSSLGSNAGLSEVDVNKLLEAKLSSLGSNAGLSKDDVNNLLKEGLKGVTSNAGLSKADVNNLVEAKLTGLGSNNTGLSEEYVNTLISERNGELKTYLENRLKSEISKFHHPKQGKGSSAESHKMDHSKNVVEHKLKTCSKDEEGKYNVGDNVVKNNAAKDCATYFSDNGHKDSFGKFALTATGVVGDCHSYDSLPGYMLCMAD